MKTLGYLTSFASATALALAQPSPTQPVTVGEWRMPDTESFVIRSAIVQREYQIMVALPRGYADTERKYPVLYVLDANGAFPIAVEMSRFLTFERSTREEPIFVGIGYPVGRFANTLAHRTRDFTPTRDPERVARLARDYGFTPDGSGGAAAFLLFLADELIPRVEQRYRIDERRRALHGYSFGGLFAFYTLFHQPDLFESYLIGGSALLWDKGAAWIFEEEFAHAKQDLPARVLLTVGSLDKGTLPAVQRLDERFRSRQYGKFVWQTQYLSDETHMSALGVSLGRGLRWLYGDMAPPVASP